LSKEEGHFRAYFVERQRPEGEDTDAEITYVLRRLDNNWPTLTNPVGRYDKFLHFHKNKNIIEKKISRASQRFAFDKGGK
jgi:hypothetical protein